MVDIKKLQEVIRTNMNVYYYSEMKEALDKLEEYINRDNETISNDEQSNYIKPPIGASPSWFIIPNRNKDLADAISRYSDGTYFDKEHLDMIRNWAVEIVGNCETGMKITDNR